MCCWKNVLVICSQRDVEQLKGILCMPSLNPDIRRAAAEQLMGLAPEPRFAAALSDAALLTAILRELPQGADPTAPEQGGRQAESGLNLGRQQQGLGSSNTPLAVCCLQLLVRLVQHCQQVKALLLQDSGRSGMHLLCLIGCQVSALPRALA